MAMVYTLEYHKLSGAGAMTLIKAVILFLDLLDGNETSLRARIQCPGVIPRESSRMLIWYTTATRTSTRARTLGSGASARQQDPAQGAGKSLPLARAKERCGAKQDRGIHSARPRWPRAGPLRVGGGEPGGKPDRVERS